MLSELRIRNFALIDNLTVELGLGLNVLTGETGAGKSIVVGALSLLLGERASADVVREGTDRATVEGAFDVAGRSAIAAWLVEHGLDAEETLLILKREVAVEGRNRAWINGSPTTAALLAELGAMLVSLHGQHQHQTLLRRDEQRSILDAFGGHEDLVARVAQVHAEISRLGREVSTLEQRRRDALQRADFLRLQVTEIEGAGVKPEEESRLEEEMRRLSHAEELIGLATTITRATAEGSDSASGRLGSVRRQLDQLLRIDPSQSELMELFDTAYYAIEELGSRLESYLQIVEHDPDRLETLRRRQDLLYRLRSKFGPELVDVLRTLENARAELALLDSAQWEISELNARRGELLHELTQLAAELTDRRRSAAEALAVAVDNHLPDLGMEGGRFEVNALPLSETSASGAEEIEFLVSLNRGFEPRPIAQVASGGELSRVMLALKTIVAELDAVPTLVFDEVDAGIGGRVALRVGDRMRQVARSHQVLAITHLPQIASRAHRHLMVAKSEDGERAATTVRLLGDTDRVHELARMMGGEPESEASVGHARELLDRAKMTRDVNDRVEGNPD
jgi:DNA repair protein RecN (Recombination protein N)